MATISVSLPSDGTTADAADYNTPITTIVNEINGGLDNDNIKAAAGIAGSKLADTSVPASKIDFTTFDSFIVSSSNLGSRTQALTASGSGTVSYSTNNPTIELAPGSYLLVATASARATIAGQDSAFGAVIYSDTGAAAVASNGTSSTGSSATFYPTYTVQAIVTPAVNTTYSGRASQSFGGSATYTYVNSSLIAIPLKTTNV